MLNNMETKDLPPENFVKLLSSGSPNLTIYKAATDEATKECMETDTIQPYHKEYITLTFKMAMVSQESLEQGEEDRTELTECEWENDDMEYSKELVLISMSKTRVAVLKERGCDPEHPCNNYGIGGCNFSNVVLAAEKCEVTTVHRQCIKKRSEQTLLIRSYLDTTIDYEAISPGRRNICEDKATSEQITVYYYISTAPSKGAPVVLNFTATNNYLKCVCDDKKIVLTIECCEKKKLKDICKDDPETWPFVFYMSTEKDNMRLFESAAYRGWFIQTERPQSICMGNQADQPKENFYFLICYNCTSK